MMGIHGTGAPTVFPGWGGEGQGIGGEGEGEG
jgi:hypothetical protein